MVKINEQAPHQAIILVKVELMEVLPTGQVTGVPVQRKSHILSVSGNTLQECTDNLHKLYERMGINAI